LTPVGQTCRSASDAAASPYLQTSAFVWSAFTLIELLVVISILGILAFLTMPALKNFAKSDATISASRQLLDGVARARQFAISQRTTVYMVFVPMNFWAPNWWDLNGQNSTPAWNALTPGAQTMATNLCDYQLTGYTFMAYGAMGDQPGNHQWHYLEPWQHLPDGTFIAVAKFTNSTSQYYTIPNPPTGAAAYSIYGFNYTNNIPFPTETNTVSTTPALPYLPYLAFNYQGQLISEVDPSGNYQDAYIPLAKGSISLGRDPGTKALTFYPPNVMEMPPGNSTGSSYNIVHIDRLTGRAMLEFQKVQQ
jgi:prepilin-type N-terminal cleavage/methylation domain-containing protein